MQNFLRLMEIVYMLFNRTFVVYGYELSFWEIFVFVVLATLVVCAIVEVFR